MIKCKVDYKKISCLIIMVLLLLQDILQIYIQPLKYTDELTALILFLMAAVMIFKYPDRLHKREKLIIPILFIYFVTGIIMQLNNNYQPIKIAALDFYLNFKFLCIYLGARVVFNDTKVLKEKKGALITFLKASSIVLFLIYILNYIFKFFPMAEGRLGFQSSWLMFSHSTYLIVYCVTVIYLLTVNDYKRNLPYILLNLMAIFLTAKFKGIGFIVAYVALYAIFIWKDRKVNFKQIIIAGILVSVALSPLLYSRLKIATQARPVMYQTSVQIAKDYFPLGTGYGTFASAFSAKEYSPVYKLYNINKVYGISEKKSSFVCDAYWAMILGQTGVIGFVLFIVILIIVCLNIVKVKTSFREKYILAIPLLYLLISSFGESSFSNIFGVSLFFLFALHLNEVEGLSKNL